MSKKVSQKLWQKANRDKVSDYQRKYMQKKAQATVLLEPWVKDKIDSLKPANQPYGQWIRKFLEEWASEVEPS
ncbi:MAG: hypothetical protein MJK14_11905 [Rivularia sp. ALOHA_DT_140]|nr:hypothetical protein [Rivularia sp. ALOHA_DT_140]